MRLRARGQSLDDLIADFIAPILKQSPQVLRAFKAVAKGVRDGSVARAS